MWCATAKGFCNKSIAYCRWVFAAILLLILHASGGANILILMRPFTLTARIHMLKKCMAVGLLCGCFFTANTEAGVAEGVRAFDNEDYKTALKELLPEAERGAVQAQSLLASMYFKGLGVPQDSAKSAAWLRKAADQGHAQSQFTLGLMYRAGEGVPKDARQALAWTEKAANLGFAAALHDMGVSYSQGLDGVAVDFAKGLGYYNKAAQAGSVEAQATLGSIYDEGNKVAPDHALAATWYSKAAQGGSIAAIVNLARLYKDGEGVKKSLVIASALYTFAYYNGQQIGQAGRQLLDPQLKAEGLALRQELVKEMAKPTRLTLSLQMSGRPVVPLNLINAIDEFKKLHPGSP
jgi:uncharacterized protein